MGHRTVRQSPRRLNFALAAAAAMLLSPAPAQAWGSYGHETTARIALANVRPATRAAIARLIAHDRELGTPQCRIRNLADAATWPDCLRGEGWRWGYTFAWHYQTEPIDQPYDARKNCAGGACVSAQVERNERILADESLPANVRLEALAFMVHFAGDIHMPLHSGDNDDKGGNDVVTAYGIVPGLNLHSVWDGALAERAISGAAPPLVRTYTGAERAALGGGDAAAWGAESHALAQVVRLSQRVCRRAAFHPRGAEPGRDCRRGTRGRKAHPAGGHPHCAIPRHRIRTRTAAAARAAPMTGVVDLAERLIACPSVTPASGLVFDALEAMLLPLGFEVDRFIAGQGADAVENLFAIRRGPAGSRHFAFAGHLDVVPPGDGWSSAPFAPERRQAPGGELLYGRGAVDMKGAIAAMVAAVADVPAETGTVSFVITGDEEGPALHGTRALIERMRARGDLPDLILVGEPTSVNRLGDMAKIGRRGSVNIWLTVEGVQGHVAYPHLADNPITKLVAMLAELEAMPLDEGTEWFQPSNLEVTDLDVGNPATNVIPAKAEARLSIRFNALHTGAGLVERVAAIAKAHGGTAHAMISGEAFLTLPGDFSALVSAAVEAETGLVPDLSTTGGTSDARFLKDLAPVIEFGLVNATMHKTDEAVAVADLAVLARIYARIARAALAR